ncbi:hypothetical protein BX600DRAFT_62981 [Xylariales sp. PMI_506]|nr:hypothetical protein BX600DRAFT_62981 [Xylariales sp. PMI_506]
MQRCHPSKIMIPQSLSDAEPVAACLAAFVVSSQALVRASTFWERSLAGPWAAAQADHLKILDYTEDDAASLEILMIIALLRSTLVPTALDLDGMVKVAATANKLFANGMTGPWLPRWASIFDTAVKQGSKSRLLSVAWQYGFKSKFDTLFKSVCMNHTVRKDAINDDEPSHWPAALEGMCLC